MKKVLYILPLIVLFITACESRSEKAAVYNDAIIDHQISIIEAFDRLDSSFNQYDADEMDYSYLMLEAEIKTGLRILDTIGGFGKDTLLLDAARDLFHFYDEMADKEYVELIDLLKIPDSLYTSEDQTHAFNLNANINMKFNEAHEQFISAQKHFGGQFNVEFDEAMEEIVIDENVEEEAEN